MIIDINIATVDQTFMYPQGAKAAECIAVDVARYIRLSRNQRPVAVVE